MREIAAISGVVTLVMGLTLYFIGWEVDINSNSLDNFYFFTTCAGISLISYSSTSDKKGTAKMLLEVNAMFFIYLLVIFGLDKLIIFEINNKWVYLPTGGILLCLFISLLRHLSSNGRQ
jgi:hypothetical protein